MKHNFSLAGNYQLPIGKGRKVGSDWTGAKNAILGGWNLNSIFSFHTGLPLTPYDGAGQSLQATRSLERPNRVCDGQLSGAGDVRLVLAARSARDGEVIQFLAGAPELLARYRNAPPPPGR